MSMKIHYYIATLEGFDNYKLFPSFICIPPVFNTIKTLVSQHKLNKISPIIDILSKLNI